MAMQREMAGNPFYEEFYYDAIGEDADKLRQMTNAVIDKVLVGHMTEETAEKFFRDGDEMNGPLPAPPDDPLFTANCTCGWPGKDGPPSFEATDFLEACQMASMRHDADFSKYSKRKQRELRPLCRLAVSRGPIR